MSGYNWTNEDVLKLIELFQERELLWNTLLDDYKNRNKKHDAWMDIANIFNLDKLTIEKKIRSLMGQFQRECKKPGSGGYEKSKWFAFKKLMFLKDRNRSGLSNDAGSEDNDRNNGGESSGAENTSNSNTSSKKFTIPKTYRKRNRPEENQDTTSVKALKILKNMYDSQQSRDHIDAFGEYVTMKLKEMKNSNARNTAQYHINNILYNASIGEYDQSPSVFVEANSANSSKGYNSAPSPSSFSGSSQDNSTQSLFDDDQKPYKIDEKV